MARAVGSPGVCVRRVGLPGGGGGGGTIDRHALARAPCPVHGRRSRRVSVLQNLFRFGNVLFIFFNVLGVYYIFLPFSGSQQYRAVGLFTLAHSKQYCSLDLSLWSESVSMRSVSRLLSYSCPWDGCFQKYSSFGGRPVTPRMVFVLAGPKAWQPRISEEAIYIQIVGTLFTFFFFY